MSEGVREEVRRAKRAGGRAAHGKLDLVARQRYRAKRQRAC